MTHQADFFNNLGKEELKRQLEEIKRGGEIVTEDLLEETARGVAEIEKFLKPIVILVGVPGATETRMNGSSFPRPIDAPDSLRILDGSCGPMSAWQVLKYFGQDVSTEQVLSASRFDVVDGVYAIGIAVALAEFGLRVSFFSDPDTDCGLVEQSLYARASARGVSFNPGVRLVEL